MNLSVVSRDTNPSIKVPYSSFKQQEIQACQPILSARNVSPAFFIISLILLSMAALVRSLGEGIRQHTVEFTDCFTALHENCADKLRNTIANHSARCECDIEFTIPEPFYGDVYVYYGLTNFFQNHRAYVRSRDHKQLAGYLVTSDKLDHDCNPYLLSDDARPICPCGSTANSVFNDTLRLFKGVTGYTEELVMSKSGMVWITDQDIKFNNAVVNNGSANFSHILRRVYEYTAKPSNWVKELHEYVDSSGNIGLDNEELIIWMRLSAFPDFVKPYGHFKSTNKDNVTLEAGKYTLAVEYNYPVKDFSGTKRILITNTGLLGGYNPVLWYSFAGIGCMYLVFSFLFAFMHFTIVRSRMNLLKYIDVETSAIT